MMENFNHPLVAQSAEIADRGLVVFDDIRTMPLYDEPYVTDLKNAYELGKRLVGNCRMG